MPLSPRHLTTTYRPVHNDNGDELDLQNETNKALSRDVPMHVRMACHVCMWPSQPSATARPLHLGHVHSPKVHVFEGWAQFERSPSHGCRITGLAQK